MKSLGIVVASALALAVAPAQAQAQSRAVGEVFRDCADCPEMVVIPAGSFMMGSPESESGRAGNQGPQRRIVLAQNFAVGRYEVTRGQYAAFVRATGRAAGDCSIDRGNSGSWERDVGGTWQDPGFAQGDDHPVVCVSWDDARAYTQWLNAATNGGYRLLSEAEWEYAARAGSTGAYPWGADVNQGCAYANAADAMARAAFPDWTTMTCDDGAINTSRVGAYQPNAYGLFDMHGNATEWASDCYVDDLGLIPTDGSSYESNGCQYRPLRGGSWATYSLYLSSANRSPAGGARASTIGFRVARSLR